MIIDINMFSKTIGNLKTMCELSFYVNEIFESSSKAFASRAE